MQRYDQCEYFDSNNSAIYACMMASKDCEGSGCPMLKENHVCVGKYEEIGREIGALVDEKNKAYGNSINCVHRFLEALWPDGIPVEQYKNVGLFVRDFDKMKRIANGIVDAFGENPREDLVGYDILGVGMDRDEKAAKERPIERDFEGKAWKLDPR